MFATPTTTIKWSEKSSNWRQWVRESWWIPLPGTYSGSFRKDRNCSTSAHQESLDGLEEASAHTNAKGARQTNQRHNISELRRVTDFESHSQVKSGKVKSEVKSAGHCDLTWLESFKVNHQQATVGYMHTLFKFIAPLSTYRTKLLVYRNSKRSVAVVCTKCDT